MHLRIVDTDASVTSQPSLRDVQAWQSVAVAPMQDLARRSHRGSWVNRALLGAIADAGADR